MKNLVRRLSFPLILLLLLNACDPAPTPSTKSLAAKVFNAASADAEIAYLSALDVSNLSPDAKAAVSIRLGELADIKIALLQIDYFALNISRCAPREPPVPCPIREEIFEMLPTGTQIELDYVGVFVDVPPDVFARIAAEPASAVLVTTDGKKVFAQGSISIYDQLFQYAWFRFDVKNAALAKKPLILKVTSTITKNQQRQTIVIQVPVPPSMFLADNLN